MFVFLLLLCTTHQVASSGRGCHITSQCYRKYHHLPIILPLSLKSSIYRSYCYAVGNIMCHNLALPWASLDHPSGNYRHSSEADQAADNDQSTTLPSAPLQLAALTRLILTEIPFLPPRWPCLVPRELRLRINALPLN